jgi:inner membrane protein
VLAVEFLVAVTVRDALGVLQRLLRLGGETIQVHGLHLAAAMPAAEGRDLAEMPRVLSPLVNQGEPGTSQLRRDVPPAVMRASDFRLACESVEIPVMDTLSHALLGAAVTQVAFGRKLGWRASAIGVVAAELPDLDFFIHSATDPLLNIELHRHFTHSFAFSPVIALAAALPWFFRAAFREQRLVLFLCGLLACWSHILLDACTSYGTQFLVPFSQHRFGWDFISIIDPVFTLALLAGLVANAVVSRSSRRKEALTSSSEFRAPSSAFDQSRLTSAATYRWVWAALGFGAAYLTLGAAQKSRAHAAQAELARLRGHRIERTEAMPTMANHLVWRLLYLHEGRIHSDRLRVPWLGAVTVREGISLPLVTQRDLSPAEATRNGPLRSFERFAHFSDGWIARAPGDPTVIGDMRYSLSGKAFDPIWGIRFTAPGAPTEVEWVNRSRDRRVALADLWTEITGANPEYRSLAAPPTRELTSPPPPPTNPAL